MVERARYRPPSPTLAKPAGLKVKRSGTKLIITWKKVTDASGYDIVVSPSTGEAQKSASSKKNKITITGVAKSVAGSVAVMSTSKDRPGRTTTVKFKRTGRASSPFRELKDCKKKGKKLTCR